MKELFRERDLTRINYYQELLEDAGISTFIRNENLSTSEGVVIPDYFPALCVVNGSDSDRAFQIIQENQLISAQNAEIDVTCTHCGESVPGNFTHCWSCDASVSVP